MTMHVPKLNIFFPVLLILTGCVGETWNQYATPQYGHERAEQICHPYSHCARGHWVASDPTLGSPNDAYVVCREENLQMEKNGWIRDTVSLGLEVNRCMESKGYDLVVE